MLIRVQKISIKQTVINTSKLGKELMPPDTVQKIPDLRRIVQITDYDTGKPETHKLELYKTDRIDCYKVLVVGRLWKNRIGWTNILVGIRKALPRLLKE